MRRLEHLAVDSKQVLGWAVEEHCQQQVVAVAHLDLLLGLGPQCLLGGLCTAAWLQLAEGLLVARAGLFKRATGGQ